MIRLTGAVLLFIACCGMGFWKSQQCAGRVRQLQELMRIGEFLKGEITFARTTLPEAMERIGEKTESPFAEFLGELAVRLRKYSGEKFSVILRQTMEETMKNTYLEKEDVEAFYQAACNLGYLDKEMQIHLLERYLKEQEQKVKLLTAQLPGKRKLLRSLGVLGGAFLVILFI
ncbi:MAG: stage III sporulation protein AB [Clostridiales bacterium]|nr:stage III sporulation protein AB [Clostridiales bacterium]